MSVVADAVKKKNNKYDESIVMSAIREQRVVTDSSEI